MDFRTALNSIHTYLTPQPWDHTTGDGRTITVIPAGLPADPGNAEVTIRITGSDHTAAEAGIPSSDLPTMTDALTSNRRWTYDTIDDHVVELTPYGGGGMLLTLTDDPDTVDEQPQIHIPETQRLPLASALRRALDVARDWETPA